MLSLDLQIEQLQQAKAVVTELDEVVKQVRLKANGQFGAGAAASALEYLEPIIEELKKRITKNALGRPTTTSVSATVEENTPAPQQAVTPIESQYRQPISASADRRMRAEFIKSNQHLANRSVSALIDGNIVSGTVTRLDFPHVVFTDDKGGTHKALPEDLT